MYKRQGIARALVEADAENKPKLKAENLMTRDPRAVERKNCLLYTSDAADERSSVDLGGRRIIKKKRK